MTAIAAAVERLVSGLTPETVVSDPAALARYCRDFTADYEGVAAAVLRPGSTEEVAEIMRRCASTGLSVVPHGGHTGLVGGATPTGEGGEVVLSLERMTRVRSVDPVNFSMIVDAGCVLQDLQTAALEQDLYFPLSLGAEGSCRIGGNISTNAGGLNVLRYGMTRDLVLGLEVVLPDGEILSGLQGLRKNNTGYDLKQLFIGAEGTLGVVTGAALKLFPKPTQTETAYLAVGSVEDAMTLYGLARREMSDLLSAFELIPRGCLEGAMSVVPDLADPFAEAHPWYVLMEASASGRVDLRALAEGFLAEAMEAGLVLDGVLAASVGQAQKLWSIREGMIEAQLRQGRHMRSDVSTSISNVPAFIERTNRRMAEIAPGAATYAYGHVGDGNIHYNLMPPKDLSAEATTELIHRCEQEIFAIVDNLGGSISAEHGIGRSKRDAFLERISPAHRALLGRIKDAVDPDGRMSPGRVLPKKS